MNKQDMLKVQTCVLRVPIHCHGCKDKVKKKLQKVQGVYKVIIDEEQGKVMVSGNVDPAILIEKLEKAGKHAELWGGQNRQVPMNSNMFNNFQGGNMKNNDGSQKGVKNQQKGGNHQATHQNKSVKFSMKDHQSAKFESSEDEDNDSDLYDDSDSEFESHHPSVKAGKVTPKKINASSNGGHSKGRNAASNGENGKKGGGFDAVFKSMIDKAMGKKGHGDKSNDSKTKKGNHQTKKGGNNGGFHDLVEGKLGARSGKGGGVHDHNGKNNDSLLKKGGKKFDVGSKLVDKHQGLHESNGNNGGMGGGRKMGAVDNYPMGQMGSFPASNGYHMGNFPAAQGLPAGSMNGNRFPGQGNPFNQQQQYMAQMMMNQQHGNGQDMHHPAMFNFNRPPQPAMNYGPAPPQSDPFTHIFSDENTNSCSIM